MEGQGFMVDEVENGLDDEDADTRERVEEDAEEMAKRLRKQARVFDSAKMAAKAAAKVLESTSSLAEPVKMADVEPSRKAFEEGIFGPGDLTNPEENMVVYIERLQSMDHKKTSDGKPTYHGYLSQVPYEQVSYDRIREEYGGGRYILRVSGTSGGRRNRYIGAKTIMIAGPPKNPDLGDDDEDDEGVYPGFPYYPGVPGVPAGAPGMMPGYGMPGYPGQWGYGFAPPPAEDKSAELFASMNQQQGQMFQLMLTRMESEARREAEQRQADRDERKGEALMRSEEMRRQVEELRIQSDKDREAARQQHELELKKLEIGNQDRLKQMEIMMTALKPDSQISAFTTMFGSVVELVRATADSGEKSVLGQVLDVAKSAVPAFMGGRGGGFQMPGFQGMQPQQQQPVLTQDVLAQKFRADAYSHAVQNCPPGHQILEKGVSGQFYVWPSDAPVPEGMIPRYPTRALPAPAAQQPAPAAQQPYQMNSLLLVSVLQKMHQGQNPAMAPFVLVAEGQMGDAVRIRIGDIFSESEPDAVLMNLLEFLTANGAQMPQGFTAQIGTSAGLQWIHHFLFSCQYPSFEEANEALQEEEVPGGGGPDGQPT